MDGHSQHTDRGSIFWGLTRSSRKCNTVADDVVLQSMYLMPTSLFPPSIFRIMHVLCRTGVRIYQRHFATWEPTSCEYSVGLIYRKYFWWHDSIFVRQRHFLSRTAVPSPSTETIGYELLLASCNDRLFTRIHTLILGSSNPAWWTFLLQPPADNTNLESK